MNALTRAPHRGWNLMGDFDGLVNGILSPVRRIDTNHGQVIPAMDIVDEGVVSGDDVPISRNRVCPCKSTTILLWGNPLETAIAAPIDPSLFLTWACTFSD